MIKNLIIPCIFIFCFACTSFAQVETLTPQSITTEVAKTTTIPLSEMELIPPQGKPDGEYRIIPNQDHIPPNRGKSTAEEKNNAPDLALQTEYKPAAGAPETIGENFEGIYNTYGVAPPDTDGDVGPDHYIQMVNNGFQIFDKNGNALTTPADLSTIWANLPGPWVGNFGDPVVLYDELADRWLLTQFSLPGSDFYLLLAVSATNDPLGSYHLYVYAFDNLPDYPKFAVWPDGYYCSINQFELVGSGYSWAGAGAIAFERDEMLDGNTAQMIFFSFTSTQDPWSFLPADFDGPPPPDGSPNYFSYIDYWSGTDRLRIYEFETDWTTPSNSTFSGPFNVNVASFSQNANSVPQSGTVQTLDVISNRLMYRLQYRNFGSYQTLVTNHTVNAGSGRAGVRWYELRKTTGNWSMYQQGTYAPPDGLYRWMGSAAMNNNGDIALGYSVSGTSIFPSIRFTGRQMGDPLGQMTISEETIFAGTSAQTGVNRWGDYSAMSVDPSDETSFWYTQEYSSGGWNWRTRIASFSFAPPVLTADFTSDVATILSGNAVTFTDVSLASPNSWNWSFEGGTPSSFSGQNPPPVTYTTEGFYDVSLTVSDGVTSNTVTKSNFIYVTLCSYCPSGYSNTSDDWISNVTFNTLNKNSGSAGYEDCRSLTTNVAKGSTYPISVTIPVVGTWVQHCFVFIDWNQDCDFNDAGESYDLGQTTGTGTLSSSITVPAGAQTGLTQMRVAERWNQNPGACDNATYGEVEDYTINVTGGQQTLMVSALLEGPYNGPGMGMELVPYMPLVQPFNTFPWNYSGSESVGAIPGTGITDWVFLQVREASSPSLAGPATIIGQRAAFLRTDGAIVDLDGTSPVLMDFSASNNIYLVVWHRNHLPVMSTKALLPVADQYSFDFSLLPEKILGGEDAQNELDPGIWGLVAGDGDQNGTVETGDKDPVWSDEAGESGYHPSDYNLDAQSDNKDKIDLWLENLGRATYIPD